MAAPTKTVPHPGRALLALAVLIVIMLLGILGGNLFSPGNWHKDFKVGLGLDLSSGTQVTMKASTPTGGIPSKDEMNEAISIILARVNGTGNSGAQVQTEGNQDLNVSVPGKTTQQTEALVSTTALLMFRQVLLEQPYTGPSSPSASPSASASASPSGSATPKTSGSPTASASSTASTSAKIVRDASPSASPSATASASSGTAKASATPSPSATSSASASSTVFGDQSAVNKDTLKLFNKLVCKPGDTTQWKKQIGYNVAEDYDNADAQIVSCDASGNKYALDKAVVPGTQISGATAVLSTTSNQWQVNLTFKSAGASAFAKLTAEQAQKYYPNASTNQDDAVLDEIAIVLDGNTITAPQTQSAIPGGNAQITDSTFTQATATDLQNQLKYGSLPLNFKILSVSSVSPALGRAQLNAGLIAAAIGLALVVLYSFFYYRGLGIVSVSSLIVAGLLATLSVILLSKYQGFTLELSGIAGLIVAIGITADSFVVFFERLRDEVREGKALRPAVEAGWKRARRTILVSDTVSFIAALLLYYFSIGEVKGFAYTLGLTTLIDIVVVFLFTKPMVTLLARTKFFGGGAPMSGLDPARLGARTPWRSSVRRDQTRGSVSRNTAPRNTGGS